MNATTQERSAASAVIKAVTKAGKASETEVAAAPEARVVKAIARGNQHLAQYKRNDWIVYATDDLLPEDLEDPSVWLYAGADFGMHDRVEVIQSRRWTEGIVCDIGTGYTTIKVMRTMEMPVRRFGQERKVPAGYRIEQGRPGQDPWLVIREEDGFVMQAGLGHRTYEDALRWILDHNIFRSSGY